MALLILNRSEVHRLLPMDECIKVVGGALWALARGEAVQPLRAMTWLPDRSGLLGTMPAVVAPLETMGAKLVSFFPGNHGTDLESHQGAVLLFETRHGQPIALVDGAEITATRTAAASGVATRELAREDAGDLAILGTGVQGCAHLEAMRCVRSLRRVRLWDVDLEVTRRVARREGDRLGLEIEAVRSAQAAVEGADLICTTTGSPHPVLYGEWLSPGAHVNAVGACTPEGRELDARALQRARLYVDRRESLLAEAGDFLLARADGVIDESHLVGELGEVLTRAVEGRRSPEEITLFESLGLGVEDLAAAHHVYRKAREQGVGLEVDLDGRREEPAAG